MRADVIIAIDPDVKASGVAVLDIPKRSVEAYPNTKSSTLRFAASTLPMSKSM